MLFMKPGRIANYTALVIDIVRLIYFSKNVALRCGGLCSKCNGGFNLSCIDSFIETTLLFVLCIK